MRQRLTWLVLFSAAIVVATLRYARRVWATQNLFTSRFCSTLCRCALLITLRLPVAALADTWQIQVGAQNDDRAHQALAFLPNEIWIHIEDSITWSFPTNEVHTVTFLALGQVRPNRFTGCPGGQPPDGRTPDFSGFDNDECVNSGILTNADGKTYTVIFPATGNFKLVCLAHPNMTATVHVLDLQTPLPHEQEFYDRQADRQSAELLSEAKPSAHVHEDSYNTVVAGAGEILGTAGGTETASVMRFMDEVKVIHAGETVEWTTAEAVTSHTITFGSEPDSQHQIPPSSNVTVDADGARHAYLSSPSDAVHSGFITELPQDRIGLAQAPFNLNSATRFRATFTQPGIYQYKCVLHDELGMVGVVIVLP
jgi:plastocyanin